jgi:hypothetical protein
MAAWRHHDFTQELLSWQPVAVLGREMQAAYEAGERPTVAESFLRSCAAAVSSPQVVAALALLERADEFRVSVTHPDDGREFVVAR